MLPEVLIVRTYPIAAFVKELSGKVITYKAIKRSRRNPPKQSVSLAGGETTGGIE